MLREATNVNAARITITSHVYVTWSGIPGRRKIGGCSIASIAQRSASADARPRAIKSQGNTVNPATSATGCAQPVANRIPHAAVHAANRSPAPTIHAAADALPVEVATNARATSHRKFTTARAPPTSTPRPADSPASHHARAASVAAAAHVSSFTLVVSSLGVIEPPVGAVNRSKEVDESRRDPESQPDQQEPGRSSQQAIRVVAPDEPDNRRHHQLEPHRGECPERFPGSLIPGRRHVKKDTSTMIPSEQAIGSGCFRKDEDGRHLVGSAQPHPN